MQPDPPYVNETFSFFVIDRRRRSPARPPGFGRRGILGARAVVNVCMPASRVGRLRAICGHLQPSTAPAAAGSGRYVLPLLAGAALGVVGGEIARRAWCPSSSSSAARLPPLGGPEMTAAERDAEAQLSGLTAADLTVTATASPAQVAAVLEEFGAVIIERAVPENEMEMVNEQLEGCICTEQELRRVERQAVRTRTLPDHREFPEMFLRECLYIITNYRFIIINTESQDDIDYRCWTAAWAPRCW